MIFMLTCAKGTGTLQDIPDISCSFVTDWQGAGLGIRPGHTLFKIVISVRRNDVINGNLLALFLLSGIVENWR